MPLSDIGYLQAVEGLSISILMTVPYLVPIRIRPLHTAKQVTAERSRSRLYRVAVSNFRVKGILSLELLHMYIPSAVAATITSLTID